MIYLLDPEKNMSSNEQQLNKEIIDTDSKVILSSVQIKQQQSLINWIMSLSNNSNGIIPIHEDHEKLKIFKELTAKVVLGELTLIKLMYHMYDMEIVMESDDECWWPLPLEYVKAKHND